MKNNNFIPIVFAFDNNFSPYAFISISSLIYHSLERTRYKIYCIISDDVTEENIKKLKQVVKGKHQIYFIKAHTLFKDAHQHRGITTATYYRLMAHDLLPDEDKIIYSDVDILFNGDLSEAYNTNLKGNVLAGVKNLYIYQVFDQNMQSLPYWKEKFGDFKGKYINAGFIIMNLKEIRESKIWKEWLELSKNKWEYHDQDILNMTCKGKILYLAPKYNTTYPIREKGAVKWGLFSQEELSEKPIVYHFTGSKPWNAKYIDQSYVWWSFVKNNTNMYPYFINQYKKKLTISKRLKILKNSIKKLTKFKII